MRFSSKALSCDLARNVGPIPAKITTETNRQLQGDRYNTGATNAV